MTELGVAIENLKKEILKVIEPFMVKVLDTLLSLLGKEDE